MKKRTKSRKERDAALSPQFHGDVAAACCQKRRRRVKRDRGCRVIVPRQSRHTSKFSCRRVAEEVAARESARAQPECVTDRAFAVEAQQPSSKYRAQSPPGNQQQPVLRANTTYHCVSMHALQRSACGDSGKQPAAASTVTHTYTTAHTQHHATRTVAVLHNLSHRPVSRRRLRFSHGASRNTRVMSFTYQHVIVNKVYSFYSRLARA